MPPDTWSRLNCMDCPPIVRDPVVEQFAQPKLMLPDVAPLSFWSLLVTVKVMNWSLTIEVARGILAIESVALAVGEMVLVGRVWEAVGIFCLAKTSRGSIDSFTRTWFCPTAKISPNGASNEGELWAKQIARIEWKARAKCMCWMCIFVVCAGPGIVSRRWWFDVLTNIFTKGPDLDSKQNEPMLLI